MTFADPIDFILVFLFLAISAVFGALAYRHRLRKGEIRGKAEQAETPPAPQPPRNPELIVMRYRTRCVDFNLYLFSFEKQPGGYWRAYIIDQPPYSGRDDSNHATHRTHDGDRHHIDWPGPVRTFEQAKLFAAMWAEATDHYIFEGFRL